MIEEIKISDIEKTSFDVREFAAKEEIKAMNPLKKLMDAQANLIIETLDGKTARLHVLNDDGKYHNFNGDK